MLNSNQHIHTETSEQNDLSGFSNYPTQRGRHLFVSNPEVQLIFLGFSQASKILLERFNAEIILVPWIKLIFYAFTPSWIILNRRSLSAFTIYLPLLTAHTTSACRWFLPTWEKQKMFSWREQVIPFFCVLWFVGILSECHAGVPRSVVVRV